MFENYFQSLQPEQRPEITLKTITRFSTFFTLGVFVSQLVRVIPELRPMFWILAFVGLGFLSYAIRVKRDVRLMTIAAIVVASLLAGHWDLLSHGANEGLANIQEVTR